MTISEEEKMAELKRIRLHIRAKALDAAIALMGHGPVVLDRNDSYISKTVNEAQTIYDWLIESQY